MTLIPSGAGAVMALRKRDSHLWPREGNEHYVEPEWVSARLFAEEPFAGAVWDPACGFGRICEAARAAGHTIVYSDIVDRGYDPLGLKVIRDFLQCDGKRVENVVTNPPFDIAGKFAIHALTLALCKVAIVFPVARLNAAHWLRDMPLSRIWLLTPRPSMPPGCVVSHGVGLHGEPQKVGGGKMDYCWLVFTQGFSGHPETRWLRRDPTDRRPVKVSRETRAEGEKTPLAPVPPV